MAESHTEKQTKQEGKIPETGLKSAAPVLPPEGLDIGATRKLGYDAYRGMLPDYSGQPEQCACATYIAVVGQLNDRGVQADADLSAPKLAWQAEGDAGAGDFCAALSGACAALHQVCPPPQARELISELLNWYAETPLPSNRVATPGHVPSQVIGSSRCHYTVQEAGRAQGDADRLYRQERCARIAGDVAARVAALLNDALLAPQIEIEEWTISYQPPGKDGNKR